MHTFLVFNCLGQSPCMPTVLIQHKTLPPTNKENYPMCKKRLKLKIQYSSPSYKALLIRQWPLSYQARFQMQRNNKTILNFPVQERSPLIKGKFFHRIKRTVSPKFWGGKSLN